MVVGVYIYIQRIAIGTIKYLKLFSQEMQLLNIHLGHKTQFHLLMLRTMYLKKRANDKQCHMSYYSKQLENDVTKIKVRTTKFSNYKISEKKMQSL